MKDSQRVLLGTILVVLGIFIIFFFASFLSGCADPKDETYTLTSKEQEIVDLIYAQRNAWENKNGTAKYIRFKEKGNLYLFLVTHSNNYGESEPFEAIGLQTKYTVNLSENKIYTTLLKEDNSQEVGIISGVMESYDVSWSREKKIQAIGKVVSGKSTEIKEFTVE